jgi:hypothetical protein
MAVSTIGGNVFAAGVLTTTIDLASVAAATSAAQTFTVPGLKLGDFVAAIAPSTLNAGLGIVNARVSATDTLSLTIMNATAGALDAASGTYTILVVRPESGTFTGFAP